jgi:hypothetical protein
METKNFNTETLDNDIIRCTNYNSRDDDQSSS